MAELKELIEKYQGKLEDEELSWEEMPEAIDLLIKFANQNEEFEFEFEMDTITWQFEITDKPEEQWMWVSVDEGKFDGGQGKAPKEVDLTFKCDAELAANMVAGAVDSNAAYMKGDLKLDGPIPKGVKFQTVLALFKDELEFWEEE